MQSIFFQSLSLVYVMLIGMVYFSKKRINNIENRLYGSLIITNMFGLVLDIFSVYTIIHMNEIPIINLIVTKAYLIYLLTWITILTIYMKAISNTNNRYIQFLFIYIISLILIVVLPLNYFNEGAIYSYGMSANYLYLISGVYMVMWIYYLFKSLKNFKKKKYLPMFAYMSIGLIVIIIQNLNPEILLMTSMETFVTFLMYFTIENPDLSMIEQLRQNKSLIEKSNEDKSNFLFRMTQEVRKPIDDIIKVNNIMDNSNDIDTINKGIKYIEYNAKELKNLINNVLDISKIDAYNIKMIDSTYNIYNVYSEMISRFSPKINKNIQFRYNISKNIPKDLYGDAVKIKQVITTILQNAIDYTNKGFIDFNIDSIVKNDICRLIITIEDSGKGMSLDKVNELLSIDDELNNEDLKTLDNMNLDFKIASKIVKLLGGHIIIKSEEDKGSEFIVSIEQRIKKDKKNDFDFEDDSLSLFGKKKVLVVDDKNNNLTEIVEFLKKYNIEVYTTMYGQDCIDRILNKNKYDLILMGDEMSPKTGLNTLQELQKINKFKTPVIIMLDKNKEAIKHHYINDGFKDYILKSDLNKELDRIIKKYI